MNERILELAIEAREYAETKPDIYQVAYDKKFAELIVKECVDELRREWFELNADTIDDASADPRATGIHLGQKTGAIKCISRIKQHFGVEE